MALGLAVVLGLVVLVGLTALVGSAAVVAGPPREVWQLPRLKPLQSLLLNALGAPSGCVAMLRPRSTP